VIFEGETTFGYEEWSGPLVSVSGTDITVTGASGAYLNGNGADWWDGEGSNGGKTKPKFFYAHSMISSTITDVYSRFSSTLSAQLLTDRLCSLEFACAGV
jgi:hypothetical protein